MKWVDFVKDYAKKHNLKYGEALKQAKGDWKKHKDSNGSLVKVQKGGNIKMTIQEGDKPLENTKAQRAKRVRQYNKALKGVASGLRSGNLDQEEYNDFVGLARSLQKTDKDKYAKAIKRLTKEFNSKKYEKLSGKKRQTKLTPQQEEEQFAETAKRTTALQTGARTKALSVRALNVRVEQLKRLGMSEEEATNIAKEEQRQQQESKALTAGITGRRITGAKIGMSYPDFIKQLQNQNNISYADAVQMASANNLWKKYQIEQLKKAPATGLGSFVPQSLQPSPAIVSAVNRANLLRKDGQLKQVHRNNIDKFLTTWGANSGAFNLGDRAAVLGKSGTEAQMRRAQEASAKYAEYPTINPLEKSRLEAISSSLQGFLADPTTPFRRRGRGARAPVAVPPPPQPSSSDTSSDSGDAPPFAPPAPPPLPRTALTLVARTPEELEQFRLNQREGQKVSFDGEKYVVRNKDGQRVLNKVKKVKKKRGLPAVPAGAGASGSDTDTTVGNPFSDDGGSGGGLDLEGGELEVLPHHGDHMDITEQAQLSPDSRKHTLGDYTYNRPASDEDHAIYVDEENKRVLVAIKNDKKKYNEDTYQKMKHYIKEIHLLLPKYTVEVSGKGVASEYAKKIGKVEKIPVVIFKKGKSNKDGGSMSGGALLTEYSHPNMEDDSLGQEQTDGNVADGEVGQGENITNRQMESVLGSYGGSLENLSKEKVSHIAHRSNQLFQKYTPNLVGMKAQSLDTLQDFKKYNRDFDREVGAIHSDISVLHNYINRIGDKHLRKDMIRQSKALKEQLNNFVKQIRQVFAQNRTLRFKNRLNNDRSILKDTSAEEAVKGGSFEGRDVSGVVGLGAGLIGGEGGIYKGGGLIGGEGGIYKGQNQFVVNNQATSSGRNNIGRVSNASISSLGGGDLVRNNNKKDIKEIVGGGFDVGDAILSALPFFL